MKNHNLTTSDWPDYELLDSGENMKLERYGNVIVSRPETQAIWKMRMPDLWRSAHASFAWGDSKGSWQLIKQLPEPWTISWRDVVALPRLTAFKHTGVFPEQAPNWEWVSEKIRALNGNGSFSRGGESSNAREASVPVARVLNLFGYTGIATIAAAKAGAAVTHVDASKQSVAWARENAAASGIPEDSIRWLIDDALAFAKREMRRGNKYDGIILDPPAFGRGTKGEVWHIEENLPELLEALRALLSDAAGAFFLLNGYAAGYAPQSFAQLMEDVFPGTDLEYGELRLAEKDSDRVISSGIYARFAR